MQTEETRIEYAGFGRRVGGFLIDVALLFVVYLCACFGIGVMIGIANVITGHAIPVRAAPKSLWLLLGSVIAIAYYSFFESGRSQATPGKRILGIYVTDLDQDRITFSRALGRYFGKYLSALILYIGFLMCAWTERSQCLHDKLAKTLVVRGRV
jgi:uncharacterized RDD family membrane protein YckC